MSDDPIDAFRSQHNDVLLDSAHPEHSSRVDELSRLFEAKFGGSNRADNLSTRTEDAPLPAIQAPTLAPEVLDGVEAQLTPAASPEAYEFKQQGMPEHVIVDGERVELVASQEFEETARHWLFEGQLTPAEGRVMQHLYYEEINHGHTAERQAALEEITMRHVHTRYGDGVDDALKAVGRVVREIETTKPGFRAFLDASNLGSHPQVMEQMIRIAIKRGYFKEHS